MKVIKEMEAGRKKITVVWEGKTYGLDRHLSQAMTGGVDSWEDGICTAKGYRADRFYLHDSSEDIIFPSPIEDWWKLPAKRIGEELVKRAEKVREWRKSLNYREEAEVYDPQEGHAESCVEPEYEEAELD